MKVMSRLWVTRVDHFSFRRPRQRNKLRPVYRRHRKRFVGAAYMPPGRRTGLADRVYFIAECRQVRLPLLIEWDGLLRNCKKLFVLGHCFFRKKASIDPINIAPTVHYTLLNFFQIFVGILLLFKIGIRVNRTHKK